MLPHTVKKAFMMNVLGAFALSARRRGRALPTFLALLTNQPPN
jgi:hypothetical protein